MSLVVPARCGVRRRHRPTGRSLRLVTDGLVKYQSWIGASGSDLGAGWTEDRGDWSIDDNTVDWWIQVNSNSSARQRVLRYTGATVPTPFVTAYLQAPGLISSFENASILCRYKSADYGTWAPDAYMLQDSDNGLQLNELTAGTATALQVDATIVKGAVCQLYCADGVQQGWRDNGDIVAGADTTWDGQDDGYVALMGDVTSGITAAVIFGGQLWIFGGRDIVVTGLQSGEKAKLRNGSQTVIAQATESGGVATINCSRYQEVVDSTGCDELPPSGASGFGDIVVTDAADEILVPAISGPIHPGSTFDAAA